MKNSAHFFLLPIFLLCCNSPSKTSRNKVNGEALLTNKSTAPNRNKFPAQPNQGIDFIATGNEPFWSFEIDFDKSMFFKTLNGFEMTASAVEGIKAMDANVIRYSIKTEQGVLIIQIAKQECINDMSGKKSGYRVTIDAKDKTATNFTKYMGCGHYLADYRLHDIWVLDSINDKKMQAADFVKGLPLLELNLTKNNVMGHTGCNSLDGTIEVLGKKIRFGKLATTRIACDNSDFESAYFRKLDNKTVPYYINPGRLYLRVSADSTFVYRKID